MTAVGIHHEHVFSCHVLLGVEDSSGSGLRELTFEVDGDEPAVVSLQFKGRTIQSPRKVYSG